MTPSLTSRVLAGTLLVALAGAPPAPAQVSTLVSGNPAVGDAIVLDDAGDIFVTSYSSQVATVDQAGTVTVLATDMSLTTGLTLHAPTSTLYVGNNGTGTIRTVPVTGGASSVFLTGVGAVGLAQNASEDTLYVAHYSTSSVSRIALDGVDTLTTFASSNLNGPTGLAFGDDGFLYVSNFNNGRIKRIDADGNVFGVGRPPDTTTIGYLAHHDGFLYATSFDGHQIWKVAYDGTMQLYAGTGIAGLADGPALSAQFNQPNGITTTVSGDTLNVWVSEYGNRSIRRIIEVEGVTSVTTTHLSGSPGLRLGPGRPNPFAGDTRVTLELASRGSVVLSIHDVSGRRVRTLASGEVLASGTHTFRWNGRDDARRTVATGTYFLRAASETGTSVVRVTRMR